jgi:hypothetical protein
MMCCRIVICKNCKLTLELATNQALIRHSAIAFAETGFVRGVAIFVLDLAKGSDGFGFLVGLPNLRLPCRGILIRNGVLLCRNGEETI